MIRLGAWLIGVALLLTALGACESEADEFQVEGDESYFLFPDDEVVRFQVDSVVYDPIAGGTARYLSQHTWTLEPLPTRNDDEQLFEVTVRDTAGRRTGRFLWTWEQRDGRSSNTIGNTTLVGLVTPFTEATVWNPLLFAAEDEIVSIAGEPVAIYKGWGARIDSTFAYTLPGGQVSVPAVGVSLASSENLLELRDVRETYGEGVGLLSRTLRILDTQNTDASIAWEQRAEVGFSMSLRRIE